MSIANVTMLSWCSLLELVKQGNCSESVKRILSNGTRSALVDRQYLSQCLYTAAVSGQPECVQLLLDAGALPDVNIDGQTPLVAAVRRGHVGVVRALVAAGVNVNKASRVTRSTALHWAAANGDRDCLTLLMDAGARLEVRMDSGRTPLMVAARCGREEIVVELLRAGNQRAMTFLSLMLVGVEWAIWSVFSCPGKYRPSSMSSQ